VSPSDSFTPPLRCDFLHDRSFWPLALGGWSLKGRDLTKLPRKALGEKSLCWKFQVYRCSRSKALVSTAFAFSKYDSNYSIVILLIERPSCPWLHSSISGSPLPLPLLPIPTPVYFLNLHTFSNFLVVEFKFKWTTIYLPCVWAIPKICTKFVVVRNRFIDRVTRSHDMGYHTRSGKPAFRHLSPFLQVRLGFPTFAQKARRKNLV